MTNNMRNLSGRPWPLYLLFALAACNRPAAEGEGVRTKVDIAALPAIAGEYVQAVIEIPAGTNHKIEYDYTAKAFRNNQVDGKDRVIDFLPYPGNYGFIPGTLMDELRGGDGDALDVLILGEAQPTGTVMPVIVIGVLLTRDRGEIDSKIIAVPADPAQRILRATDFMTFALEYDAARRMIEDWFLHYKGRGVVEIIRWEDHDYARQEIERWRTASPSE